MDFYGYAIGLDFCRFPNSFFVLWHTGNPWNAAVFHYDLFGLPTEGMAHSTLVVELLAAGFVLFPNSVVFVVPPTETLEALVQSVPSLALDFVAEEAAADAASRIFAAPSVLPLEVALILVAFRFPSLAIRDGSAPHCCRHIWGSDSDHSAGSLEWILAAVFPQSSIGKRSVPHCRGAMDELMGMAPRGK
jgi:hypothetical protein